MKKMLCSYILARYAPDPLRDEAVNIGVIFQSSEKGYIGCRFLDSFSKVKSFDPSADTKMLRDFADRWKTEFSSAKTSLFFNEEVMAHFDGNSPQSSNFLEYLSGQYEGTLKFTRPRTSLVSDLEKELENLYVSYVLPSNPVTNSPISNVALAPNYVRKRLFDRFVKSGMVDKRWVVADYSVPGTEYPHTFDIGFRNGHVQIIQSLALDVPTPEQKTRRALLFKAMVNDAKAVDPSMEAEVVVKAPTDPRNMAGYSESIRLLEKANIEVRPIEELPQVVEDVKKLLEVHHALPTQELVAA